MRWTILAVPALCLLAACQPNNDELMRRLDAIEKQQPSSDDAFKTWLMNQSQGETGSSDRRLTAMRDDMTAQLDKISQAIKESQNANRQKIDELDSRIQKIGNMEAGLASLKAMLESLESKVKAVDPNEALKLHKEVFTKEFELQAEQKAHAAAVTEIEGLKAQLAIVEQALAKAKQDLVGLQGEDISRHPMYRELKTKLIEAEAERDRARSDYSSLDEKYQALVEQVRGSGTLEREPSKVPSTDYDFTGSIDKITLTRSTGQSLMIVKVKTGRIPPVGTEVIVLDARNQPLCRAKVVNLYHSSDNPQLPIESLGCQTIDQQPTRPPTEGDTVVWKSVAAEGAPKGNAGGE